MIENLAYWVSTTSGLMLIVFGLLACKAYYSKDYGSEAGKWLGLAIILGFATHITNTAYWQVFGQWALYSEVITVETFRLVGSFLDVFFKGGAAVSAYMHLVSLKKNLPREEQSKWWAIEMPWYPKGIDFARCFKRKGK